jgi:hypothetical protein
MAFSAQEIIGKPHRKNNGAKTAIPFLHRGLSRS